ncbi:inner-membrane translocator [halophilic archaeon]|nr:inner-membrane translocator [halophilic archaeon]
MAAPAQEAYEDLDRTIAKEEILPRIDDEVIAEHENNPIGQHSDDLERILTYFRRQPVEDKYVLVETEKDEEWRIGKTPGIRGETPEIVDEQTFDSQEEAEHGLFLKRIENLREEFSN